MEMHFKQHQMKEIQAFDTQWVKCKCTQGGLHGNALQAAAYEGYKATAQLLLEKGHM